MNDIVVPDEPEDDGRVRVESAQGYLTIGQWYWLKYGRDSTKRKKGAKPSSTDVVPLTESVSEQAGQTTEDGEMLVCLMHIGSNFAEFRSPERDRSQSIPRILLREVFSRTRHEPNADALIARKGAYFQGQLQNQMEEIRKLTEVLGVNQNAIPGQGGSQSRALAVLSGQGNVEAYKLALQTAKDKKLPEMFEAVKQSSIDLSAWMGAPMLPLQAAAIDMRETIEQIEQRIFNIGLYTGLTENTVSIADGEPAAIDERLRVMQRRLYMDEECLLDYDAGGMDFKGIKDFDRWLTRPANLNRILPFKRCLVAFRVRRNRKEREIISIHDISAVIRMEMADETTYIYMRNGDQLHRMNCSIEFDEMIFPEKAVFDPGEPLMAKVFVNSVDQLMSVREYEVLHDMEVQQNKWVKEVKGRHEWDSPYRSELSGFRSYDWKPYDEENLYYDEITQHIADRIQHFNRIALVVQGLFDRSMVFHPHLPVKTWLPQSFAAAIELVYDASNVLSYGEAPDFEEYRAKCNASLKEGSVVVGQEHFWLLAEGERESNRRDNDYRYREINHRPKLYHPAGNPGPGEIARVAEWKPRSGKAVFKWKRQRLKQLGYYQRDKGDIDVSLQVPQAHLLNIDAYKAGDYRQFFVDPRTRAEYLQWAPLLLAAEDYLAGKKIISQNN